MPDTLNQLEASFNAYIANLERGMVAGLAAGQDILQEGARAAESYNNQTGATRSSTVAFAVTSDDDGRAAYDAAIAAAEELDPGSGVREDAEIETGPDRLAIVLTSATRQTIFLERANAGAHAFLGPTMEGYGPAVAQAVFRKIDEAVK